MKRLIIALLLLVTLLLLAYVAYNQHCMTHYCGTTLILRDAAELERGNNE